MKKWCFVFIWISINLHAQSGFEYIFRQFSINEGLSQYDVSSIVQDNKGYIWVGTYHGLNRYDGYQNLVYRHSSENNNCLSGNRIVCLETDSLGFLWIGIEREYLTILNLSTNRFMNIKYHLVNSEKMPFSVTSLKRSSNNELWAGTRDGEIYKITLKISDIHNDTIILTTEKISIDLSQSTELRYLSGIIPSKDYVLLSFRQGGLVQIGYPGANHTAEGNIIEPEGVNCLFIDSKENLWVGKQLGLSVIKYLKKSNKFINVTPELTDSLTRYYNINSFAEDKNRNIWISSYSNGLYVYNPNENFVVGNKGLVNYNKYKSTLSSNKLSCLYIDRSNCLWVGTHQDGIEITDLSQKKFYALKYYDYHSTKNEIFVSSVFEDSRKRIWVATEGDGLFCYDMVSQKRFHKGLDEFRNYSSSIITRIFEDVRGNIWFCSWQGLVYLPYNKVFNEKSKLINPSDGLLPDIPYYSIVQDEYESFWLASINGLYKFKMDPQGMKIISLMRYMEIYAENGILGTWINCLEKGNKNTLWAGTHGNGLCRIIYNQNNDNIIVKKYSFKQGGNYFISNNIVWWILNQKDTLWVGTDEGLNQYAIDQNNQYVFIKSYNSDDGLASNKIVSILNDDNGNLWLGTGNGLSKFLKNRSIFVNYNNTNGLQNNCFYSAACKSASGYLFFGGIKGLNYFIPEQIIPNNTLPQTCITDLMVFNESVIPGKKVNGQVLLNESVSYTNEIYINYKNNDFALKFSGFHFASPLTIHYSYKLEGYNKKWINSIGNERTATYSNLAPGEYYFKVRASNTDLQWESEPKSLKIIIGRPPWMTWWAYSLYGLFVIICIGLILKYYRNKMRYEHEIILEKRLRANEHELTQMKVNFYANISHELRTPLTLIIAPVSEIKKIEINNTKLKELLDLVFYNSEKLLKLINQLLHFSKIETEEVPLHITKSDINDFLRKLTLSFIPLATQKNIDLSFSSDINEYMVYFDSDIIDKIVSNIIYNGIKYTSENGVVLVQFNTLMKEHGEFYSITITDSGMGINPDEIEKIFEKYYQHEKGQGYGIGLSFVKKLVLAHYGTINVKSDIGVGTTFCIEFPSFEAAYLSEMKLHVFEENIENLESESDVFENNISERALTSINKKKELILVVEDNDDLRNYLSNNLSDEYIVLAAPNGREGLNKAVEHLPDLIISDIIMPEMNGIELAKAIKQDFHTNHIPFIFLTAKSSIENQITGLTYGAEDYIVKPFDINILRKKIFNLLQVIKINKEKQKQKLLFEPQEVEKISIDDIFLQKATKLVNENISNLKFDISIFSSEMAMSRMQLHRKLKGVINMSANEFIRSIKMKRAAELLKSGKHNVAEVMYEVGFDNHSYFAKVFKRQFGQLPTEYLDS